MIRRPPRSTQSRASAASDVYKRQVLDASVRRNGIEYVGDPRCKGIACFGNLVGFFAKRIVDDQENTLGAQALHLVEQRALEWRAVMHAFYGTIFKNAGFCHRCYP